MPSEDPTATPNTPPAAAAWQLRLLGAVELRHAGGPPLHWPSRPAAALLARLALAPQREHPREELVELLWPGVDLDVGRNRLRQTLSTLKRLLEAAPDGVPLVDAARAHIRLHAGVLSCDATEFERLARSGAAARARALYGGELMPGHYEDWVLDARAALAALHERLPEAPMPAAEMPLPASWTRAFGIEPTLARLCAWVGAERLVTVVGPGGCGKTRLALETARALRQAGARGAGPFDRVAFVPLADCGDDAQATAALARALGLAPQLPLAELLALLAAQPTLLVLDNVEQLIGPALRLPQALLEGAGALHLLLTSRQRLALPGERRFELAGLPLPAPDDERDRLLANPALALFIDRARAVRADFEPAGAEARALVMLVHLLDGMPLALELAASRVASFAPSHMVRLLSDPDAGAAHLRLLSRPLPRAAQDPRHASIAEVIDWSWRLLDADEQRTLTALALFTGDAGLDGLAAVLGEAAATVALRLDELAAQSMLRVLPESPPRYALLEPVRDFVLARAAAPALAELRQAQQRWLLQWARQLAPATPAAVVDAEARSVLTLLAMPTAEPATTLQLALALRGHWESAGMPAPVQRSLVAALERHAAASGAGGASEQGLASAAHELLAYLRYAAGFAAEAAAHADAALRLAGDEASMRARALARQAWVDLAAGRRDDDDGTRAARLHAQLDQALALAHGARDSEAEARILHQQAVLASQLEDDWALAESLLARSQAIWLQLGDRRKAFARLRNRGQCWLRLGRADEARDCFEQCERVAREDGDATGRIDSLLSLSSLLGARRQWHAALDADRECVRLCWRHWNRHGLAYALWNPPRALAHLRRPEDAQRLMAFAAGYWESKFGPLASSDRATLRRVRGLVQAQCGRARSEALWTEGATMTVTEAVALALRG